MKHLSIMMLLAIALTGCNAMTTAADRATNKHSSFSQDSNTRYPTTDELKDSEPASFAKQNFN